VTTLQGLRIAHATTGHAPDDDRIFYKEARSLARAGADVILIYPAGRKPPADAAGVMLLPYNGGGSLRRRLLTVGKFESALRSRPFDLIHCHEPDGLVAALRVKRNGGARVIYDSHELWPGVAAQRFPPPCRRGVMWAFGGVERRYVSRCDAAIGATWAITDYLSGILGPDRTETILNVPVAGVFGEGPPREWGEETILCHEGHLSFARGLKTMAEAVCLVAKKHRVIFKIVGDVFGEERAWLDGFVTRHGLGEVIIRTGWLPYEQVGKALGVCHIGLLAFYEVPNSVISAPNKIFNYLMYGIPFVGPTFILSLQTMAEREGLCTLADPQSPVSYADAICRLIEDRQETAAMAARALKASRTRYRWEHMEPKLFALYERVLGMKSTV